MKIKLKDQTELKKLLIINGYSQTEFAKKVEVTPTYLNQIVNEERSPSAKLAKKISDELKVSFEDIFFIEDACCS